VLAIQVSTHINILKAKLKLQFKLQFKIRNLGEVKQLKAESPEGTLTWARDK